MSIVHVSTHGNEGLAVNVKSLIRRTARAARAFPRFGVNWSARLAPSSVPLNSVRANRSDRSLCLEALELSIDYDRTAWLLEGYQDALALKQSGEITFSPGNDREIIADARDFRIAVRTAEELYILREILVDRVYDLSFPSDAVVWDIGMNVGIASLYFAARKGWPVFAYELSRSTFEFALTNLSLNPGSSSSITARNIGIGGESGTARYALDPCKRGSTTRVNSVCAEHLLSPVIEEGTIEGCCEILDFIVGKADGRSIVAKVDCEGSEYEIIDVLCATGRIRDLSALVIEWHGWVEGRQPAEIVEKLTGQGFATIPVGSFSQSFGILHAFRTNIDR